MGKTAGHRKREIMEVAKNLFMTQGYEKTTIDCIIKAMGVSKGMFYHHYKSKEEVLDAVLDDLSELVTKDLVRILTDDTKNAKEKIKALYEYNRETGQQIASGESVISKEFFVNFYGAIKQKYLGIVTALFTKLIYEGVEQGLFHVKSPRLTALFFTALAISAPGMQKEHMELYEDFDETMSASKELLGRVLGCDFDE